MGVQSSAGTTLGISLDAPSAFTSDGYAALPFEPIGEITDIGDFGGEFELIKHNPLKWKAVVKRKGSFDAGSITLGMGLDKSDPGQDALAVAAWRDSAAFFCITLQDGFRFFFPALVMSFRIRPGSADAIVAAASTLEVTPAANGSCVIERAPDDGTTPPDQSLLANEAGAFLVTESGDFLLAA